MQLVSVMRIAPYQNIFFKEGFFRIGRANIVEKGRQKNFLMFFFVVDSVQEAPNFIALVPNTLISLIFVFMWAVFKKDLRQFFSSLTGYIAMIVFLLVNGLFLFVFPETSIFNFGYATLDKFFELAPWIFLLLIPAITMRSFSDEFRTGTFEILQTKPVSKWEIVNGKYLACLVVIVFALLPTAIYIVSVQQLSEQNGIDIGATAGSYGGLFFLAAVFASIGLCCSSFSNNAVVSFMAAAFLCFVMYNAFGALSLLPVFASGADYYLEMIGIDFHYHSLSRGVIDSRDIVYFLSLIGLFLMLTKRNLAEG